MSDDSLGRWRERLLAELKTANGEIPLHHTEEGIPLPPLNGTLPSPESPPPPRETLILDYESLGLPSPEEIFRATGDSFDSFQPLPTIIPGHLLHEVGADGAVELGMSLALLVHSTREQNPELKKPETLLADRGLTLAIRSCDFYGGIAKFLAARILFSEIKRGLNCPPNSPDPRLIGFSSLVNKTIADEPNNLIRASIEGIMGLMGGCDLLTLQPWKSTLKPNEFRFLRFTTLAVLQEEGQVGGSELFLGNGLLQGLAGEIANRAWDIFVEIERRGGMDQVVAVNWPWCLIRESRTRRSNEFKAGKRILIGVNRFPPPANLEGCPHPGALGKVPAIKNPLPTLNRDIRVARRWNWPPAGLTPLRLEEFHAPQK